MGYWASCIAWWVLCAIMASTPTKGAVAQAQAEARADSVVARARDAARRDDHVDAMLGFREAIALSPERRAEWVWELADQTLWAGLTTRAIPLYREFLAQETLRRDEIRQGRLRLALAFSWGDQLEDALGEYDAILLEDPEDREAWLGRGRVLSWLGRNGEAQASFEEMVRLNRYDYEAHRELGRMLSWRGRQRQAQSHLHGVLAARPDDVEAVRALAQAQWWMGRPDRAMQTLREFLQSAAGGPSGVGSTRGDHRESPGRPPGNDRLRDLLLQFDAAIRGSTRIQQRESRQSDDLAIGISEFAQDFVFNQGLTTLGPRYQFQRYDPEDAAAIRVHRPGVFGRHRFSDGVEWTGQGFLDWIEVPSPERTHERFTYSTWLTLWPNDFARFDVGSDRSTLDNVTSLTRNIVMTSFNLSSDVLPNERLRFVGRAHWADLTDGNARLGGQIEAARRWLRGPFLWSGIRSTAFHFRELRNHGYFNPRDYIAVDATLRLFESRAWRLRYACDGSAGYEHASPGGDKFIWSAAAHLDLSLGRHVGLGLDASHFSSATASSSGFARTSLGGSLRFLW